MEAVPTSARAKGSRVLQRPAASAPAGARPYGAGRQTRPTAEDAAAHEAITA